MSVSRLAAMSLVALLFLGCTTVGPNPKRVPRQQELIPEAVPVTLVTLEADANGYKLADADHFLGSPTPTILKDLPVLITAYDDSRKEVGSVSVFNPREGHWLGTTPERQFTLEKGTVTVRFEDPKKRVSFVTVQVRRGPNLDQPPDKEIWVRRPSPPNLVPIPAPPGPAPIP